MEREGFPSVWVKSESLTRTTESTIETFVSPQQEIVSAQLTHSAASPFLDDKDADSAGFECSPPDANDNTRATVLSFPEVMINEGDLKVPGSVVVGDGLTTEEERVKEMAQILDFRRRVDKAKLTEESRNLDKMRAKAIQDLSEEASRIEEQKRIEKATLHEEARLLEMKRQEETVRLENEAEALQTRKRAESDRISNERHLVEETHAAEEKRLAIENRTLEEESTANSVDYARKIEEGMKRLEAAKSHLEAAKRQFDEDTKVKDGEETKEKGGGFLRMFGGKKRPTTDLAREKEKQQKMVLLKGN